MKRLPPDVSQERARQDNSQRARDHAGSKAKPGGERRGLRRQFVLGGLGAMVGCALPGSTDPVRAREPDPALIGTNARAAVPRRLVSLADYGGRPGGRPASLAAAFVKAFAALSAAGGGTLFVPPGIYDFGMLESDSAVLFRNAQDMAISAYGATFMACTGVRAAPNLFYFFNFSNITIAGASFVDTGFVPWLNWKGMHCVGLQANQPSRGFRMVDCHAECVVGLLASHNNAAAREFIGGVSVHGEVRNTYYGVGANNLAGDIDVDLICYNVRRACIAYALRNARLRIRVASTANWPGSNGLVALVASGGPTGNVENVTVSVDATGAGIHGSYVHFYHQGPERRGCISDVDATVNLVQVRGAQSLYIFDHESNGILQETDRCWDRIRLHGKVVGPFEGRVVSNPSVSQHPGRVYVDHNLAMLAGPGELGKGFQTMST